MPAQFLIFPARERGVIGGVGNPGKCTEPTASNDISDIAEQAAAIYSDHLGAIPGDPEVCQREEGLLARARGNFALVHADCVQNGQDFGFSPWNGLPKNYSRTLAGITLFPNIGGGAFVPFALHAIPRDEAIGIRKRSLENMYRTRGNAPRKLRPTFEHQAERAIARQFGVPLNA